VTSVESSSDATKTLVASTPPKADAQIITILNAKPSVSSPSIGPNIRTSRKAPTKDVPESLVGVASQQSSLTDLAVKSDYRYLPRNPNHPPLGFDQRVAARACEEDQPASTSDGKIECFQPPTPRVRCNAAPLTAISVTSRTRGANSQTSRAKSIPKKTTRSTSFSSLADKHWNDDLADMPGNLTPQKRSPTSDVFHHSGSENERLKVDRNDGFELEQQGERLLQEEIQRGKRARQLFDSGDSRDTTTDYEKIRKLANQRSEIRSRLPGKPHRPLATQTNPFSSSRLTPGLQHQQMLCLPLKSPLNNVIDSASLQEQIVQAKVQFNIAQNQLIEEKAKHGCASKAALARVTSLNATLAALNKRRYEIRNDADRMDAFRRFGPIGHGGEAEHATQSTPKSPTISPTDSEWKTRLSFCYEAIKESEHWHKAAKHIKSESATLSADDEPMIKQETSHQNWSPKNGDAGKRGTSMPQWHQARFALTDVETFL
jgi:hypothetical protein